MGTGRAEYEREGMQTESLGVRPRTVKKLKFNVVPFETKINIFSTCKSAKALQTRLD